MNQVPRDPMDFVVGDRVPGTPWVMRGKLGEGGMGLVLDVVKEPGVEGAMKVMLPGFAKRREFVTRFFDEVRLLAQLRHPNIVQVFDFGQLEDGTPYVVMERLVGVTLRAGLRNFRQKGTPISAKLIYEITRQLCEGLFRAHSNTPVIVHRDVKPENIFFHQPERADAVVKVIDFGIAAVLDGTRDRRVFGTPRHMAPEQIGGHAVTPATDVYAVALVLYELLTDRFPWEIDPRNELALVEAHLHRPPTPPSRYTPWIPPLVEQWVLRALSKDPRHRPQDAYQFIAKLYQLQFVNDGTTGSVADVRGAGPPLSRLAEAVGEAIGAGTEAGASGEVSRDRSPSPVEGPAWDARPALQGVPPLEARPLEADPIEVRPIEVRPIEVRPIEADPIEAALSEEPPMEADFAVTRVLPWSPRAADFAVTRVLPWSPRARLPRDAESWPSPVEMASTSAVPLSSGTPPAGTRGASISQTSLVGRDAVVPAAVGATLVVGLFVAILYLNGPQSLPSAPGVVRETERASAATWNPGAHAAPRPPAPPTAPPVEASPASPTAASSPVPAGAPPQQTQAVPAAGGVQAAAPAALVARQAARAATGPSDSARSTHEPDDGRDPLYGHP